jgi:endonuclease/exonuclease/phosphatase family metal-dependent hydrolase
LSHLVVVTLNTRKGEGNYIGRLAAMTAGLRRLSPGLILLQEVFAVPSTNVHTARTLAGALGLRRLHHPARCKPRPFAGGTVVSTSGLAILSRLPLTASRLIRLSDDPVDGERVAQVAQLGWGRHGLTVVNVHLSRPDAGEELRRRQLVGIVEHLRRIDGGTVLLGGDFNCGPDDAPIRWLKNESGFVVDDAWTHAGEPIPTLAGEAAGGAGRGCFDHLFLLLRPGRTTPVIREAGRVLDRPDAATGPSASSHFGLRAVVRNSGSGAPAGARRSEA